MPHIQPKSCIFRHRNWLEYETICGLNSLHFSVLSHSFSFQNIFSSHKISINTGNLFTHLFISTWKLASKNGKQKYNNGEKWMVFYFSKSNINITVSHWGILLSFFAFQLNFWPLASCHKVLCLFLFTRLHPMVVVVVVHLSFAVPSVKSFT